MENENTLQPWVIIVIAAAAVVIIAVIIIVVLKVSKNKKIKASEAAVNQKVEEATSQLATCFGGNDNIKAFSQRGSRVTVEIQDMALIDKEKISSQLENVMYMGSKVVFVIGSKSEDFSKLLQQNVEKLNK